MISHSKLNSITLEDHIIVVYALRAFVYSFKAVRTAGDPTATFVELNLIRGDGDNLLIFWDSLIRQRLPLADQRIRIKHEVPYFFFFFKVVIVWNGFQKVYGTYEGEE